MAATTPAVVVTTTGGIIDAIVPTTGTGTAEAMQTVTAAATGKTAGAVARVIRPLAVQEAAMSSERLTRRRMAAITLATGTMSSNRQAPASRLLMAVIGPAAGGCR